jgi:ABC-type sugar transport system substrate-binding protein
LVVGVSNLAVSFPFPASIGEGIKEEAKKHGVKMVQTDVQGDVNKQTNDVQRLIAQQVDGIILLPVDSGVATRMVDNINDASIPVISVVSQVGEDGKLPDVYQGFNALAIQSEVELPTGKCKYHEISVLCKRSRISGASALRTSMT